MHSNGMFAGVVYLTHREISYMLCCFKAFNSNHLRRNVVFGDEIGY